MPVLTERVCRTIDRYRLLPPGARVLVAASGGADSTALAWLLRDLAARLSIELAGLAHFNHTLRGASADADQEFCRALAEQLAVPFVAEAGDVRAAAKAFGTSIEDAGRCLRYAFLDDARGRLRASHVAVGHTRDDQAETVLLHLLRGSGTLGLGGMPPARDYLVRPLIECGHAELVAWLSNRGRPYREDASNLDRRYARNRLRHAVMPVLDREFPGALQALARSAGLARMDAEYLDALAAEELAKLVRSGDEGLVIDAGGLAGLPRPIATRVARLALSRVATGRFIGADHAVLLADLAAGVRDGRLVLPGAQADRFGGEIVIRTRQGRSVIPDALDGCAGTSVRVPLSIPGEAPLEDGRVVSSDLRHDRPSPTELKETLGPSAAVVDAGLCTDLAVRHARPGDRFRPLGLRGRKSLQDFFVDRKVPRRERARVPLVVDGEDRIVWVAGHAVSGDFRVTLATRAVIILKLRGERV